jgi:hypothetical protein
LNDAGSDGGDGGMQRHEEILKRKNA